MTHLPFVAGSYVLGVVVPAGLALSAYLRMRSAARRLASVDPRARRALRDFESEDPA